MTQLDVYICLYGANALFWLLKVAGALPITQYTAMKTHFNVNFLEDSTETLRAVAHPIRIAIIDLLYNHGQMTVTDIYQQLSIEQAIASHHLRILKGKDVVTAERDGKNSLYSLTREEFYEIIKTLKKVI